MAHRFRLETTDETHTVQAGNVDVVRSDKAVRLIETIRDRALPAVLYFPLREVVEGTVQDSDRPRTRCPIKGECRYLSVVAGGEVLEAAAWVYDRPLPGAEALRELVAFDATRLEIR